MRLARTRRGVTVGLLATLVTMALLNLVVPTSRVAEAQDDPTPTPEATQEPTVVEPTPLPTLELSLARELLPDGDVDGDGLVDPGDTVTFTINLANGGAVASGPIDVILEYDAAFAGAVTVVTPGGQPDTGRVTWSIVRLGPGESTAFSAAVALNRRFPPGRSQIQAAASVQAGSAQLARVAATPIEVIGPVLRITDIAFELVTDVGITGRIDPGDTVRFLIGYANSGGGPSSDVAIVADYPDNLTGALVSVPEGAQDQEGKLTWLLGSVPADGEVRTLQYTTVFAPAFPPGVTTYDLVVTISDGTSAIDTRTVSVPVAGPSLLVEPTFEFLLDGDADGLIDAGDQLRITLTLRNLGTEVAQNVSLRVSYDPTVAEVISSSEGGTLADDTAALEWTIPAVEADGSALVTFEVRILPIPANTSGLTIAARASGGQFSTVVREMTIPADAPTPTPELQPTGTPSISESRPAQGQGILGPYAIAMLIGGFLLLSLLAIMFVASRVLPGTAAEREAADTLEERADHRRLVRELLEGVILTAILFSVMILGLQNALDQDSVNSIIAGIVGYVAGRVASSR